jgi:hypothetical protein
MIKFSSAILLLILSHSLFAYEVPVKLKSLLKNKQEQVYVGQGCEMKAFQDNEGFHIAAYERDSNGNIDKDTNYGKFTLNNQYELDAYWDYSNGFEALSYYRSGMGSYFDLKSRITLQQVKGVGIVDIFFQRFNGIFFYTFYHFSCEVVL